MEASFVEKGKKFSVRSCSFSLFFSFQMTFRLMMFLYLGCEKAHGDNVCLLGPLSVHLIVFIRTMKLF